MKKLCCIILLFLNSLFLLSQEKAYLLKDSNEKLITCEDFFCYIFANEKDLNDFNYSKNNKFPLKDTITGELDLSQMGKPKPYLEVSAKIKETSYMNQEEYKNLNVFTHGEFTKNFTQLRKNNYDFFFIEKINNDCYKITPMYIYSQE